MISNGTLTKYYSNTTRDKHLKEAAEARAAARKSSNSFEFTSWWADARNKPIKDLTAFAKTFFAKHTLLNILTRYCVLTADHELLVMRPYQIVATERILQRIDVATNYKQLGTVAAGGYVWHTTGSGKTLTSLQDRAARVQDAQRGQGAVRRRPQGPRLPDHARVRPLPEGRRELQHLHRGAQEAARGPERAHHHHDHPEARELRRREQGPRDLRRPRRADLRRVPPLPVRRHAHRDHQGVQELQPVRLHRHADLRGERRQRRQPAAQDHRAGVRRQAPHVHDRRRHHRQERAAVPHRLRQHHQGRATSRTRRSRRSTPSARCWRPSASATSSTYTLEHFDQKTKRASGYEHSVVTNVAESTRVRRQAEAVRAREAGARLQRHLRHRVDRRREALLLRVRRGAEGPAAGRGGSRSG